MRMPSPRRPIGSTMQRRRWRQQVTVTVSPPTVSPLPALACDLATAVLAAVDAEGAGIVALDPGHDRGKPAVQVPDYGGEAGSQVRLSVSCHRAPPRSCTRPCGRRAL